MQETRVRSLGQEDPWRKKWQSTSVFLPAEFHGQRNLVGYIVHGIAKNWTWLSDKHFPSIRVFSSESALCIRWPKYWRFNFSISPSNVDFLYDRQVWSPCCPRDPQDLLQHHSSKASVLRHSAFFIVQLSHPYLTTRKTIALTRWTFVGKVLSLLFNMLSRFVTAFHPRRKRLFVSFHLTL